MNKAKKMITTDTYLKTVGLLELAKVHYSLLKDIEDCLTKLLQAEPGGHISDCIWGEMYTPEVLFDKLNIMVNKDKIFKEDKLL